MQLFAFGVNHTTASVDIREQLSFPQASLPDALRSLKQQTPVREAVILSTCNRTELYCGIDEDASPIIDWLSHYHAMSREQLNQFLYVHPASAAVRHLLRVASGLDSMVLGEPQILGQLKTAYRIAQQTGALGKLLSRLFQYSFAVAKQVRTDTAIGSSPVSVAFAAVRLAQQIFGDLRNHTALLIGAGETIELAARHLHANGLGRMIVANRTLERARVLATTMGGYAITLPEIPNHLAEADVVISSTASETLVLTADQVRLAIRARKHRPMFMVDIAVPRDIDPAVSQLDDVYLYSIDDLNDVIQDNLRSREEAAHQAEEIIDAQVDHFIRWMQSLETVGTICQLRQQVDTTRQQLLVRAKQMLSAGRPPEVVLEFLAHRLTNTLLHEPCVQLRQAGADRDTELVDTIRQLFKLPTS